MPVPTAIQSTRSTSRSSSIYVAVHYSATDFLDAAEPHLAKREREANTILPLAQSYRDHEVGHGLAPRQSKPLWERARVLLHPEGRDDAAESERVSETRQFWLTLWSSPSTSPSTFPILDLVLSCTASHIDNLPIFLWSSYETSALTDEFLQPRMSLLLEHLSELVPRERVFSVFAPNFITKTFADIWASRTGMKIVDQPYYSAALTFCTRDTLAEPSTRTPSLPPLPFTLRQAKREDAEAIAAHCYDFAYDSDFPIDRKGALREALHYINNRQMWACAVECADGHIEIASIVAVTRNTRTNATITKVHTASAHRKRGYAEALVRHVCEHLLYDDEIVRRHAVDYTAPYDAVALYVAHDNIAAATVYDRVGFAGLLGKERPLGVEDVLELGFEGATKGYW